MLNIAIHSNHQFYTLNLIHILLIIQSVLSILAPNNISIKQETLSPTPMDQFIGINAFIDDPIKRIKVAGIVREYHNWSWNDRPVYKNGKMINYPGYPNNTLMYNLFGGAWNFDEFYGLLRFNNIEVVPCIMKSLSWLNKNYGKPVPPGSSTEDPLSYYAHADFLFQYAARYGSKVVNDSILKVRKSAGQRVKSGMNLIKYYENWNEPNAWWMKAHWNFSATEFAAMSSADFDGHLGKMSNHQGIKAADPAAKMVMGGLVGINLEYLIQLKRWSDEHRDGSFPFDVINMHHYSKTSASGIRKAISPEEDSLGFKVKKIVNYRNDNLPGKEIWLSEFGYDTNPNSPQAAPKIKDNPPEITQAQWLIRSFLILSSTGIDRAFMYMLRDVDNSANLYATSGLTTQKGEWEPKPSWYYLYTLKNTLKGMYFAKELPSDDPRISIYKYVDNNTHRMAMAIWCNTSSGINISEFRIQHIKNGNYQIIRLVDKSIIGKSMNITAKDNTIKLNITETPVFLVQINN